MKIFGAMVIGLFLASRGLAGPAEDRVALQRSVGEAQRAQIRISNFLEFYGVEVMREPNLEQKGSLSGSLSGGGSMRVLGNVGGLANGLLGLAVNAGAPLPGLNPIQGLYPLHQSVSNLLSGLSGWGYGSMSISGQIHGEFEGKGVEIHNQAHLFLVLSKDEPRLNRMLSRIDQLKATHPDWIVREDGTVEQLRKALSSPHIVSELHLGKFREDLQRVRREVQTIEQLLADNIGSDDPIYRNTETRLRGLTRWMNDKRVVIGQLLPESKGGYIAEHFETVYEVYPLTDQRLRLIGGGSGTLPFRMVAEGDRPWLDQMRRYYRVYERTHYWFPLWQWRQVSTPDRLSRLIGARVLSQTVRYRLIANHSDETSGDKVNPYVTEGTDALFRHENLTYQEIRLGF